MKFKYIPLVTMFLMTTLMGVSMLPVPARASGPASPTWFIQQYANTGSMWSGLKIADVDYADWSLSTAQYQEWLGDPNLQSKIAIMSSKWLGMLEFDLNSNRTVDGLGGGTIVYPGKINPMNDSAFRRAIAKAVDKNSIALNDFGGELEIMDVPLPSLGLDQYINGSVTGSYPVNYGYSLAAAAAALDTAGYPVDNTKYGGAWRKNPAGNNLYDELSDGINHGLIFYERADKLDRMSAGQRFAAALVALKIPVLELPRLRSVVSQEVVEHHAFHIYTGGWDLVRDPDYLHDFYTADFMGSGDYNFGMFQGGPAVETALDAVKFAPDKPSLTSAAKHVQSLLWGANGLMPGIILGTYAPTRTAYRKDLATGIINQAGLGARSWWSSTIGKKISGDLSTLRIGASSTIEQLNPITSQWIWDWEALSAIYDTLIGNDPYTLATDMPVGLAQNWRIGTSSVGGTHTQINFTLRSGLKWQPDPARGFATGAPLTTEDVKFSILYNQNESSWNFPSVMGINNVRTHTDDATIPVNDIVVDFNVVSVIALHWVGGLAIVPKYIWQSITDFVAYNPITGVGGGGDGKCGLIGSGPYTPKRLGDGTVDSGFFTLSSVTLQANTGYFLSAGQMEAFLKEAFRRRGDTDYSGFIDITDLFNMASQWSAAQYQPTPTWTDDVYPGMIFSPPVYDPGKENPPTQPYPPFDDSGIIISGIDRNGKGFPWKYTDIDCDNTIFAGELGAIGQHYHEGYSGTQTGFQGWP